MNVTRKEIKDMRERGRGKGKRYKAKVRSAACWENRGDAIEQKSRTGRTGKNNRMYKREEGRTLKEKEKKKKEKGKWKINRGKRKAGRHTWNAHRLMFDQTKYLLIRLSLVS